MRHLVGALVSLALLFCIAAPRPVSAAPHDLKIINDTQHAIEYIQISPPTNTKWGDDWLDSSEVLEPGDSKTFSITQGCVEDIRVTWMDHHSREWRNFDTCQYDLDVKYEQDQSN